MIEPKRFAASDLACARGGRLLFEGFSLAVEPGGAVLALGPNGVGKSSLLRILAGLLPAASGGFFWGGEAIDPATPEHARLVGFMGALDPVKPILTVGEHVAFALALAGQADDPDRVDAALDRFGLHDDIDMPGRRLSTGRRRRLSLAQLALSDAPLWLLDEPATGLDGDGRAALATLLAEHRARGGMVIAASHQDLGLVEPARVYPGATQAPEDDPSISRAASAVTVVGGEGSRRDRDEGRSRSAFAAVLGRDLSLSVRQASDAIGVLVFFVIAATLFPLGVGPEPAVLARIAAGVVWVTALLAAMLSFDRLFAPDYEDGSLDRLLLSPTPLAWLTSAKIAAHWLTTGLPLMIVAPVLAVMLRLPGEGIATLMIAMALGTPALSLLGALGAALTLGARRGAVLIPLLILPLCLPILIFGVGAVEAAVSGLGARPHLLILAAYLALALPSLPLATAAALRAASR